MGKTALRRSYLQQEFFSDYLETLGADFAIKILPLTFNSKEYQVKYLIWDLAGQPSFSEIRTNYFQGSHAIIVVYDVTDEISLENVTNWVDEIEKCLSNKGIPPIFLIGNKIDLIKEKKVHKYSTNSDGLNLSKNISRRCFNNKFNVPYFETSAKTQENVEKAFQGIMEYIAQNHVKI
ncbi:MAG: Rab family GTPase, partial [Candidatus Hodarchaeales archaeon]